MEGVSRSAGTPPIPAVTPPKGQVGMWGGFNRAETP